MRIRKNIGILFAVLFTCLLHVISFAADGVIYFSDPVTVSGEEFSVTMKVQSDNASLSDATAMLKYPSDSLEFLSGTDASGGAGSVRVHGASSGKGTSVLLYDLKFRAKRGGNFTVNLDSYEVYDTDGKSVNITHAGSSSIAVTGDTAQPDPSLTALEVSPGSLEPVFNPEVKEYSMKIGLSVDALSINALPSDGCKVNVLNNESLKEGDNDITLLVSSSDGTKTSEYHLHVMKEEGAPENEQEQSASPEDAISFANGIQLISKGKTITVTNPDPSVQIPEGFRESRISIDGQKVQGWTWAADEKPKYCVFYGMNENGEVAFYRYDMAEKTIQRYFEDPIAADCVSLSDYQALESENQQLSDKNDRRFIVIVILAALCVLLTFFALYLSAKIRSVKKNRSRKEENVFEEKQPVKPVPEAKHELPETPDDETKVITRKERRSRFEEENAADQTIVLKREAPVNRPRHSVEFDGFEDLDI